MATKANVEDVYPLSPMQKGMLFHSIYSPESDVYFEQMCFEMEGQIDRVAFERAWQMLVDRHAVLRTAFAWENLEEPVQVVLRGVRLKVRWEDWSTRAVEQQGEELERFLERDRSEGFRLTHAPLMRVSVVAMPDGTHRIVWSHHHLLLDGWCLNLVFNELFALYTAGASGPALPTPQPYRRYIDWLASKSGSEQGSAFWRGYLAHFKGPTRLVIDRRPPGAGYELSRYGRVTLALPRAVSEKLAATARRCHVTASTVAQVAWALLLARYSGADDVVFGATVSGRSNELPGAESMLGMFINTLPVRVRLDGTVTASRLMQQVQADQALARQFDTWSLAEIRKYAELDPGAPLFESNLAFQNYPALDERYSDTARALKNGTWRGPTNFALSATVEPGPELVAGIAYYESRFDRRAVQRMLGQWVEIMSSIAHAPERAVGSVSLATPAEVRHLTEALNQTQWRFGGPSTLTELLDAALREHADAVALVEPDGTRVRYADLCVRVRRLAAALRKLGVGPEVRVGIHLERGSSAVVGICATLLAGGAFVPVDASLPPLRVSSIFGQARPRVILTQASLRARMTGASVPVLVLDEPRAPEAEEAVAFDAGRVEPDNLAYVIYTSGSTGTPKGVAIEHRGITNNLRDLNHRFGVGRGDRILAVSSLSFDMSVYEIVGALIAGATIVLPSAAGRLDPAHWASLVREHSVTVWNSAPPLANALVEYVTSAARDALASIRLVVLGGDWVPLDLPERMRSLAPGVRLVSLGGATEASIHSTVFEVGEVDAGWKSIPYGTPLANQTAYVLDAELRPLPLGLAGELYLGGIGLGRGYDGAARSTAERFVPNPYAARPGERLYRTGDLARFGEDGVLELLGRVDHLVKIRGNRVEPDEVAAVLRRHPDVRQAIVRVLADAKGEPALAAYVISGDVAEGELVAHVRAHLPSYMVPAAFTRVDAFPLSPNGKIDRAALPAPRWQKASDPTARRIDTATQLELAALWSELTGGRVEDAGANFFEVGGDSLRALRLASAVRARMGVELPVRVVFEAPILGDLGARIDELRSSAPASIEGAA